MSDRGIQIHERLSEIKYLIKKDLSSNELHEIKKELLIYKDELINNISIFSKANNIQIRLSQIENYLEKLNDKKEKASKSVNQPKKEIEEDKKEESTKKQKKQVIWKFGLYSL